MARRFAPLLWALAFPLSVPALAQVKVEKLAEGVWATQTFQGCNVGWFVIGEDVILVDSGLNAEAANAVLQRIRETTGKPVRYLVITHAHGDHAGGAATLVAAGAEVICAENAAGPLLSALRAAPAQTPKSNARGKKVVASKSPAKPRVLAVSERLRFLGSPRSAEIYYLGPAHTSGDLIVVLPEDKILFSGDLALHGLLPYMRSADMEPRGWELILSRLVGLPVDRVVPGHGDIGPREGIADSFAYVRRANQIVKRFLEDRVPEDAIERKLQEPENRIENVFLSDDHIANVKAVYRIEKERLAKASPTPTPGSKGS